MTSIIFIIIALIAVWYYCKIEYYSRGYKDGLDDASKTIDDMLSTNLSESADEPNEETERAVRNSFEHPESGLKFDSVDDFRKWLETLPED